MSKETIDFKRIQTVVSKEAFDTLQNIAREQRIRVAEFVRDAVKRRCEELGYEIDLSIGEWGGQRDGSGRKRHINESDNP